MKQIVSIAIPFLMAVPAMAAEQTTGFAAFQTIEQFIGNVDNWGVSAQGTCRFDFSLDPSFVTDTGNDEVSAMISVDAPAGTTNFAETIGHFSMGVDKQTANQLVISGGSYDGTATLTFNKKKDGSIEIAGHWDDTEMGPNRDGICTLPLKKK